MGVSGCGKTTTGKLLAKKLDCPFYDADDYHPEINKSKMASGTPLTDADRQPWLETLAQLISETQGPLVLACSALKEAYRQTLDPQSLAFWVVLSGDFETISERLAQRSDHFFDANLLQSQFDTLQLPDYGLHLPIDRSPTLLVSEITAHYRPEGMSDFGLIGLGVMGSNLAANLLDNRVKLSVYNRWTPQEAAVVPDFLEASQAKHVLGYTQMELFVRSIKSPRRILLMVPAGKAIDAVIADITPYLDQGDVLIDGGNAHYKRTAERADQLDKLGIHWMGCGISGGRKGARFGPSMMLGGNRPAAEKLLPILGNIAAKDKDDRPCLAYMGDKGAGHFVKMVHNGVEYAEMQLLAEVYDLLRGNLPYSDIAELLSRWNGGESGSYLLEITSKILEAKVDGVYELDRIQDVAGAKGTGGWSSISSVELGVPASMITAAVQARSLSSFKEELTKRSELRSSTYAWTNDLLEALHQAYDFARLINHIQGFELIQTACQEYNWKTDLSEIARIWTAGCIIKSKLMEGCVSWLAETDRLIMNEDVRDQLKSTENHAAHIAKIGLDQGIPLPAITASYQWWLACNREKLPANLIQAQRDYFGQHGYVHTDDPDRRINFNWET